MSQISTYLTEDRRLVILRLLEQSGDYRANEYLLRTALDSMGHSVGLHVVEADLRFLQELGLATVADNGGVIIAQLTARGADVAFGRATAPGVKRPEPGV